MRRLRLYIVLVEVTSLPLAILIAMYILTGYGLISEAMRPLGLTRALSASLHTSPVLRVLLVALTALHGYTGLVVLAYRKVRAEGVREVLEILLLALTVAFVVVCAYSELHPLLHATRGYHGGRG